MSASLTNDLLLALPMLCLFGGALLILMLEVFIKGTWPKALTTAIILGLAALGAQVAAVKSSPELTIFGGFVYADPFTLYMQLILLFGSLLAVLLGAGRLEAEGVESVGEYYALFLFATVGACVFVSAAELITLFMGLEIMSMALYALCGSGVRFKRSAESALKYFLLGSFSSAFLLYGIALLYGMTGTTFIEPLSQKLPEVAGPLLYFSMGLVLVGMVFKIGAVPFHFWAPDVYQGSPTSVTSYMACVIKASAFAASLRILWVAFEQVMPFWEGAIWIIAVLTMTIGNVVALRQKGVKRMLAYSSIAHAGYLLVGFLAPGEFGGGAAMLYYLVAYTLMTMGAFGVVMVVSQAYLKFQVPDDISRFEGLGFREPWLAAVMALFMLSLAGIPPGLAGLLGKFYIFGSAVKADFVGLVIIGVLNSAISCYYYLRVIVAMYFTKGEVVESDKAPQMSLSMLGALSVCAAGVVLFGVFPSLLHDSATAVMAAW